MSCKGGLIHHKAVGLRDGSILISGGRSSPNKPCKDFQRLQVAGSGCIWKSVNLDSTSDAFEARWRHSATSVMNGGDVENMITLFTSVPITGSQQHLSVQFLKDTFNCKYCIWQF